MPLVSSPSVRVVSTCARLCAAASPHSPPAVKFSASHRVGVICTSVRCFGNAPARIRPVEVPPENAFRQSEREMSASIVIVIMFIIPLWLFVLSAESHEKKRDAVRAWALEQRAAHAPVNDSNSESKDPK